VYLIALIQYFIWTAHYKGNKMMLLQLARRPKKTSRFREYREELPF